MLTAVCRVSLPHGRRKVGAKAAARLLVVPCSGEHSLSADSSCCAGSVSQPAESEKEEEELQGEDQALLLFRCVPHAPPAPRQTACLLLWGCMRAPHAPFLLLLQAAARTALLPLASVMSSDASSWRRRCCCKWTCRRSCMISWRCAARRRGVGLGEDMCAGWGHVRRTCIGAAALASR